MWTQEKVSSFANSIGYKPFGTTAELKSLNSILMPNEDLIYIIDGTLRKAHDRAIVGAGIAFLTNKRFVFYRKSIIGTVTQEDYPITKISSASYRKGVIMGSVHIYASAIESIITGVKNERASIMVEELNNLIHEDVSSAPSQNIPNQQLDASSEIKKWFELKEQGIITIEEFEAKKKQLLGL